jgi:hypothetical protein
MKWFEPFAVLLLSIVLAFQLKLSNEIGGLNAEIGGLHAEMSKMSSQHNETHAQILTLNGKVDDATHFARNRVQALAKSTCYLPCKVDDGWRNGNAVYMSIKATKFMATAKHLVNSENNSAQCECNIDDKIFIPLRVFHHPTVDLSILVFDETLPLHPIDISKSHEPELGDRAVSYAARTPTNVLVGEGLFVGLSANDEFLFSMVQRNSFSGSGVSNGKFVGINVGRNILTETDDGLNATTQFSRCIPRKVIFDFAKSRLFN